MGGTLRMPNFKNLSTQLTLQYEIAEEKCNQICSQMKNGKNCDFALCHIEVPRVNLRFEVLFKEFHPRINLITLFFTKTYLENTKKLFLGHENWSLGPKQHNLKKPL